ARGDAAWLQTLQPFGVAARTVFEDALARFKGQVQAIERGVSLLEFIYHAQALQVVLETPAIGSAAIRAQRLQGRVQRVLARVSERCVPEVVRQRHRLDQVFVETQRSGNAAAELGDFQRVGEAG